MTCKEDWISYLQVLDDVQQPLSRVRSPVFIHLDELRPDPELVEIPFRWPSPPPQEPIPPKWEMPIGPLSPLDVEEPQLYSPPELIPCSSAEQLMPSTEADYKLLPTLQPQASIMRANKPSPLVIAAEPTIEDMISPLQNASSDSNFTNSPLFDLDLGGFELVDSGGMSAEALLSQEDPVIFHRDMPVHSVHHDTVHTEAALENLMNAPESMLSTSVPPVLVADNYCFIVDGDQIKLGDIMGDDQWWRHTSRPTKYFYSEDMKKFFRVNCITAKGKIISAKLANATPISGGASLGVPADQAGPSSSLSPNSALKGTSQSLPATAAVSSATTPRSSVSVTNKTQRGEKVPLEHVYKVIRFYSFWKTCTSFHRIVTMIDRISPADRNDNFQSDFKRRLTFGGLASQVKRREFNVNSIPEDSDFFVSSQTLRIETEKDVLDDSDDAESLIEFPVGVNIRIMKFKCEEERKVKYHVSSHGAAPVPIFNTEGVPFDVRSTLASTIECPVKFLARHPPDMVVDNYCFVVDGGSVPVDSITSGQWWKPTSVATRFYCSENRVHCVFYHGELKAAFGNKNKKAGMQQIPLKFIFKVSRYFCYWFSCKSFHRIVSVIAPVTDEGHKLFGFDKRIFVQYLWRTENASDRRRVANEYKDSMSAHQEISNTQQTLASSSNINRRFSTIVRRLSSEVLEDSPKFL
ncbi:Twk-2 [Aphelenchoides bicaudatus]|nr:Twk-2 [Aphelenchoides bicaudatus]